ncbi:MAG: hypothetical protein AAF597_05775 [Bacteroidota bacterium]
MTLFFRLIVLLICACSTQLAGQSDVFANDYQNQITLTIGLNQGYFRDRNFSPLRYRTSGLRLGLGYQRRTKAGHLVGVDLNAGILRLNTDAASYLKSSRYVLDFSLSYLRKVGYTDAGRAHHFGAKYRTYADLSLYNEADAVTFFAFHGLEAAATTSWRTGDRHRFRAAASLPVFGQLVRPPHTGWDKFIVENSHNIPKILTRGDWVFLNAFSGLHLDLGWGYQLSDHWTLETHYRMQYYRTNRLAPVRSLNNQYLISLIRQY